MNAGIALARLQPNSVYLSDFPAVTPLLAANVELNRHNLLAHEYSKKCIYSVIGYVWGETYYDPYDSIKNTKLDSSAADSVFPNEIQTIFRLCNVAIASDVIYDPIGYEPLFKSLRSFLTSNHDTNKYFVLAHRHRNPEDGRYDTSYILSCYS